MSKLRDTESRIIGIVMFIAKSVFNDSGIRKDGFVKTKQSLTPFYQLCSKWK